MNRRLGCEGNNGPMDNARRWLILAWAPHSRRSEMFASELDGKLYCIHYLRFQSPRYAPFKYVMQSLHTLWVLFKERPLAVHVQNPPFVCGLVVSLYCLLGRTRFVLDHHSAAFSSVWNWALPIQRFVARRAVTNIVTNQHWADIVLSWGAHALIMFDPFRSLGEGEAFAVTPGFNVAFVGTFAPDEPLDAVIRAAAVLPDVHFYITGDTKRAPKGLLQRLPANVTCTGFLPDAQYIGLLRAVDATMVLTTRDHTLQLGGCEAVSIGKPLITSDWPYLRQVFSKGTVYVSNSCDGIRNGVVEMRARCQELGKEMIELGQDGRREWNIRLAQLKEMISS